MQSEKLKLQVQRNSLNLPPEFSWWRNKKFWTLFCLQTFMGSSWQIFFV